MLRRKNMLLKQIRIEKGMNLADLGRATCIQQGVLGWVESGRFIPYESQLEKIAAALEWEGDLQELLGEVDG